MNAPGSIDIEASALLEELGLDETINNEDRQD